jgi:hypothetical protein
MSSEWNEISSLVGPTPEEISRRKMIEALSSHRWMTYPNPVAGRDQSSLSMYPLDIEETIMLSRGVAEMKKNTVRALSSMKGSLKG